MQIVNKRTHKPTDKDVYIGRPSVLGNPYSHLPGTLAQYRVGTRDEAIERYRRWLQYKVFVEKEAAILRALLTIPEDANLVCWCSPLPCHGEVIGWLWHWIKGQPDIPGGVIATLRAIAKNEAEHHGNTNWISVDDKMPPLEEDVLIARKGRVLMAHLHDDDGAIEWESREQWGWVMDRVTHWMPLPSLPEGEDQHA